ncbi:hypothetical protein L915_05177 [Phytophthora nicotianae]|uniref:Uncharacterized protein n=1 Tax=Phytophthora nicotianae TaxID=4792 RepID=W2JDU0_PHYNI|nr:hypothetical protein L915_05177 [Phytophthora nicotianae]ETL44579.1 hypothetical protein L916_05134 [Phytophthora nicotianae]
MRNGNFHGVKLNKLNVRLSNFTPTTISLTGSLNKSRRSASWS